MIGQPSLWWGGIWGRPTLRLEGSGAMFGRSRANTECAHLRCVQIPHLSAWGASELFLNIHLNVMSQLWLMRWLSRSIWTPRTCGTNRKLMKRATKKIRSTLTEIRFGLNWRQKRKTFRLNQSKGSEICVQLMLNGRYYPPAILATHLRSRTRSPPRGRPLARCSTRCRYGQRSLGPAKPDFYSSVCFCRRA